MTDYPEHAKLEHLGAERTLLNEFLDWLSSQGVFLVRYASDNEDVPVTEHAALAAKFLGIDESRLEAERRAMGDELRRANAARRRMVNAVHGLLSGKQV